VLGGRRGGRTRLAFVELLIPFPVGRTVGSLVVGMAWNATFFVVMPVPVISGTLDPMGRRRSMRGASSGQAAAFIRPIEISVVALVGHNKGNECNENENMLEKHG